MATESIKKVTNDSASGYCKMPDGTMIQWGNFATALNASGQADGSISFPMRFSDSVPTVSITQFATSIASASGEIAVGQANTNNVAYFINSPGKPNWTCRIYWLAIGRWK